MKAILVSLVFGLASVALAHEHVAAKIPPTFESLKGLVGTWEGTTTMNGKQEPVKVTYELTSGGTAIIEKLMPGTDHEMVTVYAARGNQVAATHYCAMGNQPEMKLRNSKGNTFSFEMDGTKGITDKNELHMHALTLSLEGNKLKQEWTNYNKAKKGEVATFEFTKTK